MADQPRLRALLTWSLAAFHAGFLFAGLIALAYSGGALGGLLGSLNTLLGLGLYGLFWLSTWWTTRRATRGMPWAALEAPWAPLDHFWRVVLWGGVDGLLLFLAVLALIAGNSLIAALAGQAQLGEILSFVVSFGALGSLVALLAGMVVGVFFALLDSTLLALAGWLAPVRPDSL